MQIKIIKITLRFQLTLECSHQENEWQQTLARARTKGRLYALRSKCQVQPLWRSGCGFLKNLYTRPSTGPSFTTPGYGASSHILETFAHQCLLQLSGKRGRRSKPVQRTKGGVRKGSSGGGGVRKGNAENKRGNRLNIQDIHELEKLAF